MRIEDVPPGMLVIASERAGKIFCLDCERCFLDHEFQSLTEDDVEERKPLGAGLYCAGCAFPFFVGPDDPPFIPLVGPVGCLCQELDCQNVAVWCYVAAWHFVLFPCLLCQSCYQLRCDSAVCSCCGEWYLAQMTYCQHCSKEVPRV